MSWGNRDFGYKGEPETCRWCGRKLHRTTNQEHVWDDNATARDGTRGRWRWVRKGYRYGGRKGVAGNGHFCTGACMASYGLRCAQLGIALKAKESDGDG